MATDPKASRITVGFPGGSLSASRGLLEAVFGVDLVATNMTQPTTVSRASHQRTRVIGGPSTAVAGATYTIGQYPQARFNGGAGGEPIQVNYNGEWWTMRLTGSHQDFCKFLRGATWGSGTSPVFRSQRGTVYGPFVSNI